MNEFKITEEQFSKPDRLRDAIDCDTDTEYTIEVCSNFCRSGVFMQPIAPPSAGILQLNNLEHAQDGEVIINAGSVDSIFQKGKSQDVKISGLSNKRQEELIALIDKINYFLKQHHLFIRIIEKRKQ